MSISYLSHPIESKVKPYTENVNLIAKVAQQKQNKYDQVLSAIFQKQNQLLDLDLQWASPETISRKDNLLKEADNQLNKFASSDLTIPDNISKVENIFTPITTDKHIMIGMGFTKNVKESQAYYQEMKKEGKGDYDPTNEAYTLTQASKAKQMSEKEFEQNYQSLDVSPIKYRNRSKEYNDALSKYVKDMGFTVENIVSAPDGGYIVTKEQGKIPISSLKAVLPNDAGFVAQAKVDAWATLGNTTQDEILSEQLSYVKNDIQSIEKINKSITEENGDITSAISKLKTGNTSNLSLLFPELNGIDLDVPENKQKAIDLLNSKIENNKKAYESNTSNLIENNKYITDMIGKYGIIIGGDGFTSIGSDPLPENQLLNLKTQYILQRDANVFTQAYAKEKNVIKIESDPNYSQAVQIQADIAKETQKYNNDVRLKQLDAELKLITDGVGNGSNSNSNNSTSDNPNGVTPLIAGEGIDEPTKEEKGTKYYNDLTTNLLNEVGNLDRNSSGEGSTLFKQELLRLTPVGTSSINELSKEEQDKITTQLSSEIKEVNNNLTNWDKNPDSIVPGRKITYGEYFKEKEKTISYINERNLKITTAQAAFDLKTNVKNLVIKSKIGEILKKHPYTVYTTSPENVQILQKKDNSVKMVNTPQGGYVKSALKGFKIPQTAFDAAGRGQKLGRNDIQDIYNQNGLLGYKIDENDVASMNGYLQTYLPQQGVNDQVDKELKKYTTSSMSIPLTLQGESTEKDPHSALKKSTIGYIKGVNQGLINTDIQINNFQPTSNGWQVSYSVTTNEKNPDGTTKGIVQKPVILSNDFVKQHQSYLKGFQSNELLNLMVAQKKFNESNDENALNNKVITSPYLQLNGKTYKLAILAGDPDGTVRIGSPNKEGIILTDELSPSISFKQAWEFMNTPFKNKQTQSSVEDIANKYLIQ